VLWDDEAKEVNEMNHSLDIEKRVNTQKQEMYQKRIMIKRCTLNGTIVGSYVCFEVEEKHGNKI
jgi:hypothetical protein